MAKKAKWVIRLGESEWKRHTYARPASDALRLLGSVRRGAQVGALAVDAQGNYLQVVGDCMVALNRSQIASALATASTSIGPNWDVRPVQRQVVAPVVVVKRRRVLAPA